MFSQTFFIACIASIASADEHTQNKLAEVMSHTQTRTQPQTLELAQLLAKSITKKDSGEHIEVVIDQENQLSAPAGAEMMLAQVESSADTKKDSGERIEVEIGVETQMPVSEGAEMMLAQVESSTDQIGGGGGQDDQAFSDFQNWVENYEVTEFPNRSCGISLEEVKDNNSRGEWYYKTVIKNTCWFSYEVTVWMGYYEWGNVSHFYTGMKEGKILYETMIVNAENPEFDNDGNMGLRFRVGSFWYGFDNWVKKKEDPAYHPHFGPLHNFAGWENAPYDEGIIYLSDAQEIHHNY